MGSAIEVTIIMDESQQLNVHVFVPTLDEDFEIPLDLKMQHESLDALRKQVAQQKTRLSGLRETGQRTQAKRADSAFARIEDERLVGEVDSLIDAASHDQDALAQLDRRVRDLPPRWIVRGLRRMADAAGEGRGFTSRRGENR